MIPCESSTAHHLIYFLRVCPTHISSMPMQGALQLGPPQKWECCCSTCCASLSSNNNDKTDSSSPLLPISTEVIPRNSSGKESIHTTTSSLVLGGNGMSAPSPFSSPQTEAEKHKEANGIHSVVELRFSCRFPIQVPHTQQICGEGDADERKIFEEACFGSRPALLRRAEDGRLFPLATLLHSDRSVEDFLLLGSSQASGSAWNTRHFVVLRDCSHGSKSDTRAHYGPPEPPILCVTEIVDLTTARYLPKKTCNSDDFASLQHYGYVEVRTDVLATVKAKSSMAELMDAVKERMIRQASDAARESLFVLRQNTCIDEDTDGCNSGLEGEVVLAPMLHRSCHFRPWGTAGPSITCSYLLKRQYANSNAEDAIISPLQEASSKLCDKRRDIHERLSLRTDRPTFRLCYAMPDPFETRKRFPQLMNVHLGVPAAQVNGASTHMVQGSYRYYHYLQGDYDDRRWGCAYRSLQTMHSWFELNGYTSKETPTHKDIQECLVSIGDKPKSIIGSKEWIGSVEVGYVLNELVGVECRSFIVNSGPELAGKAIEIADHFDTQGTPIMMGGGNLAFTILGIAWNKKTGECKFLILDPHYVGKEDIDIIQTKKLSMEGYKAIPCGWRSPSSLSKSSFHQVCLPRRPLGL